MGTLLHSFNQTEHINLRFLDLSHRLAALAADADIRLVPFYDAELPYFSLLTHDAKKTALKQLSDYVLVCEQTARSGFSIRDARALTWRMLKHLGLTPLSDAFEQIKSKDFVEIYNETHVQCFASLNFLNEVTYSLEDLYCRPWMDLYSRDEAITKKIYGSLQEMLDGEEDRTVVPAVPAHQVSETCSPGRRSAIVRPRLFSPLSDRSLQERGRRAGFMTVNEVLVFDPA